MEIILRKKSYKIIGKAEKIQLNIRLKINIK